jgi:hypothetical protein
MYPSTHSRPSSEAGYALLTVTIFVLVIVISGLAFFAMSSYETEGAMYRQESSEAFSLADGAIERARARFLADRAWRDGWTGEVGGRGTYDLTVQDTTYGGIDDAVQLVATGHVGRADRRIEVMAEIPPTSFGLPMLVYENADVGGNLCLEGGSAHVNGDADFGPNDVHLSCGTYTTGFRIIPPPIYTDPDHYPDATYYSVVAFRNGNQNRAHIYDRYGANITALLGDSLVSVMSANTGQHTFTYDFNSATRIDYYFNDATGIFRRQTGDVAVVVMFGNIPIINNSPDGSWVCNMNIDGDSNSDIHATIINTRFTGVTLEDRFNTDRWTGGSTVAYHWITFEPYYGISMIVHDFEQQGTAHCYMGTPAWPALVYVTGNAEHINSNMDLRGSIIVLGDWTSTGTPNLQYLPGFIANLPDYLQQDWPAGVSGTLKVLRWREVAMTTP